MAELADDDHLSEDMTPESPGTIGRISLEDWV